MKASVPCACGHPREMHEHFRAGTDCGTCGADVCARYRPQRLRRTSTEAGVANRFRRLFVALHHTV